MKLSKNNKEREIWEAKLSYIYFNKNLQYIGHLAFAGVQSLSKVEWEDKLAYLQVTREEDYSKQSNLSNFFPKFKKED